MDKQMSGKLSVTSDYLSLSRFVVLSQVAHPYEKLLKICLSPPDFVLLSL